MTWAIRGIIEGFYGRPWTWDERLDVMRWCADRGMTHYIYAPKDDQLHRERWRQPYPPADIAGFERLVASDTLQVGFGVSPGLSIDYESHEDRSALLVKVEQVLEVGVRLVCLALDDIPPRAGLGEQHAALTAWLRRHLDQRADVILVPTEYTGVTPTPYLDALAAGVPPDVPIAWTGDTVVCDEIRVSQAEARAAALGGRAPLIWDNYPVNDAMMIDRLFLGPLRGRDHGLAELCSGYVANPMVQPNASKLPLASTAAYLRGEDPDAAWREEATGLGLRAFAEACDGAHPRALVAQLRAARGDRRSNLREVTEWLDLLETVDPSDDLAREIEPWHEQLQREVGLWRRATKALDAVDRGDRDAATRHGFALLFGWGEVRRGDVAVMGPRFSLRPVFGQWPDGSWCYDERSVEEDLNATDELVRLALADVGALSST
jgi:hyaluronoglucosaminidase